MPAFKLPLFKRTIGLYRKYKCALLEIGGVGVYVQYDNDDELAPNLLRTCNIGIGEDYGYIEAEDAKAAILVFFNKWEGVRKGTWARALEVNRSKPILQYPPCSRLVEIDGGIVANSREMRNMSLVIVFWIGRILQKIAPLTSLKITSGTV